MSSSFTPGRGGRYAHGGGRGRGNQRGLWRTLNQARGAYRTPDPELHPVGNLIESINIADFSFEGDEDDAPKIANSKLIASYNWVEGKPNTILIPGMSILFTLMSNGVFQSIEMEWKIFLKSSSSNLHLSFEAAKGFWA